MVLNDDRVDPFSASQFLLFSDGAISPRYEFVHVLYREVCYQRIAPGRRVKMHKRLGDWIESHWEPLEEAASWLADDFEKKYPGIKVEVLRIVGIQQYQRFMQEVQAKRHNVDVLHISDQPSMVTLIEEGHIASE